ncbi:hypothetical protein [Natronomonas sp.]
MYAIPGGEGAADCDHETVRQLANDGGANRYFTCEACGSVLIREGALESDTPSDLGTVDPEIDDLLIDIEAHHERVGGHKTVFDRLAMAWWRLVS